MSAYRARWAERPLRKVGMALALMPALLGCAGEPSPTGPSVVIVLVDTLRKDHLHFYGYDRPTSPRLDALSARGVVFENHIATAAQTVPSTLSLMLSQFPVEHGLRHEGPGHFFRNPPRYPGRLHFLAEVFREAGYATAGFIANPFLQEKHGFGQGFDHFYSESEVRAEMLTDLAIQWLDERILPPEKPFFLYIHYFDPHAPYDPPRSYRRFREDSRGGVLNDVGPAPWVSTEDLDATIAAYDAEIAYVDDQIGRLLDALAKHRMHEDTAILVTSDHGEEFLDHGGLGHGTTVYGELVRVPLVIVYPPKVPAGGRVQHLSTHVDLAPTVLTLAGIEKPSEFHGRTLWQSATYAFAENGPWRTVYGAEAKAVLNLRTGQRTMFSGDDDLDQNPINDPSRMKVLLDALTWYGALERAPRSSGELPQSVRWSESEEERLKALGYID